MFLRLRIWENFLNKNSEKGFEKRIWKGGFPPNLIPKFFFSPKKSSISTMILKADRGILMGNSFSFLEKNLFPKNFMLCGLAELIGDPGKKRKKDFEEFCD